MYIFSHINFDVVLRISNITKPTQIISTSATFIDYIIIAYLQTSAIKIADVSEHLPIFIIVDVKLYDLIETEVRHTGRVCHVWCNF